MAYFIWKWRNATSTFIFFSRCHRAFNIIWILSAWNCGLWHPDYPLWYIWPSVHHTSEPLYIFIYFGGHQLLVFFSFSFRIWSTRKGPCWSTMASIMMLWLYVVFMNERINLLFNFYIFFILKEPMYINSGLWWPPSFCILQFSPSEGAPEEFDQTIFPILGDRTIGPVERLALNLVKDSNRWGTQYYLNYFNFSFNCILCLENLFSFCLEPWKTSWIC